MTDREILEAMQSRLGSAYEYLSGGFPRGKEPVEMDSHMAGTTSPLDRIGTCKVSAACRLFSLPLYW